MAMIKPFPFKVDRSCANSFRDQIVDGLRSAIDTGYYRPGDLLPPLRIAASACGASEIVVRAAYRILALDGLVVARPRVGSVVLPRKAASWKGHVLCVMGDYDFNLAQCGIVGSLRTRLMANGFLFTQVMALSDSLVRLDLSQLRNALKRKVDFAIQIFSRKEISDTLSKAGIPFVVYGKCETAPDGCVGIFRYSPDRAMRSFVVDCRKRGIGSVEVVCCDRIRPCASQMLSLLEGAGIRVSVRWLKAKTHIGRTHSAEQIGYDFICHNVNRSSSRLPDAYLVHDDYLARGMLTALNVKGFHVPEDVGFVCVTQKGFAPVFAKALTRIEMDSYAAGEKIAKRVLAWLTRKAPIGDDPLEAVYVNGSTLA